MDEITSNERDTHSRAPCLLFKLTSEGSVVSREGEHDVVGVLGVDFDNLLETTLGEGTKSIDGLVLDVQSLTLSRSKSELKSRTKQEERNGFR